MKSCVYWDQPYEYWWPMFYCMPKTLQLECIPSKIGCIKRRKDNSTVACRTQCSVYNLEHSIHIWSSPLPLAIELDSQLLVVPCLFACPTLWYMGTRSSYFPLSSHTSCIMSGMQAQKACSWSEAPLHHYGNKDYSSLLYSIMWERKLVGCDILLYLFFALDKMSNGHVDHFLHNNRSIAFPFEGSLKSSYQ